MPAVSQVNFTAPKGQTSNDMADTLFLTVVIELCTLVLATVHYVGGQRAANDKNVAGAVWHGLVFAMSLAIAGVVYSLVLRS